MAIRMTPNDIRVAVRAIMDLDAVDLPDSLIDMYMRDGYNLIINLERRWDFLETSFSMNTVVNQRAYPLATMTTVPIREVVSIVESASVGVRLDLISYDEGETTYLGAMDVANKPLFFAHWAGSLQLFPKPDKVYSLNVRAYREPNDWVTASTYVDANVALHFPIVYYIVSRVHQNQENAQMAGIYKQSFDEAISVARKDLKRIDSFAPMVLSGNASRHFTQNGWLKSLGKNLGS